MKEFMQYMHPAEETRNYRKTFDGKEGQYEPPFCFFVSFVVRCILDRHQNNVCKDVSPVFLSKNSSVNIFLFLCMILFRIFSVKEMKYFYYLLNKCK